MTELKPRQAQALEQLETFIGKPIPLVEKIEYTTFGVKIDGGDVTGLGLYNQKLSTLPESVTKLMSLQRLNLFNNQLTTLPESIGNLKSLETLNLEENQLTTLPESIGNLKSLQELLLNQSIGNRILLETLPESIGNLISLETLNLENNQLTTLPESITKLISLQRLNLRNNKFTTLPESIGNLTSLRELDLGYNKFTTLPVSLWRCKNLEHLILKTNSWEGEWAGIEGYDFPKVLEICRQRAPITIFLSHSKGDKEKYCIIKFMENLKKRREIREVYSSGAPKIPESNLFLFIATNDSITDARCRHELGLALNDNIRIIPLKGTDIKFEDLKQIDLRAEGHDYFNLKDKKGFEFDGNEEKLEEFCEELYEYIKEYKRDFNLFDAEARKIDEERENVKTIIDRLIESVEFREILEESAEQLEKLSEELRGEQISPVEYIFRCVKILDSKSK